MALLKRGTSWMARLLTPGESIVAPLGAAMALFVGATTLVLGGWTAWTLRRDRVGDATSRLEAAGALLAPTLASSLAQEDVEGARALLERVAKTHGLRGARLTLPDASVLAEHDAAGAVRAMPSATAVVWAHPLEGAKKVITAHSLTMAFDVEVPARGHVRLELSQDLATGVGLSWEAGTGFAIAGGASLVFFFGTYRWTRRRVRAMGAIREALLELQDGQTHPPLLAVSNDFGREAHAWNQMLREREHLRGQLLADQAREQLAKRAGGAGQLPLACDALWNGVVVLDEKLRIVYANPSAAVFLGARREKLGEGVATDHLSDPAVVESIRNVVSGRVRRRTSVEVKRAEGAGVLRFTVRAIGREDLGGAVVFIEDVTQQRIADEARDSFVAQATHELRTPLTNIRLYVEQAIEAGESDSATRASALNVINQESLRLERIVSDMLSVSEIEAGSIKLRSDDVRLDTLFDDLAAEFSPQAREKGLALAFEIPPKLPVIHADRDKIAQALHNLIANAIKYTPAGGRVDVKVDVNNARLSVDVTDTGFGIAPQEQELVFEKFYRAQDKRVRDVVGTGLGLPLAREVARLHGGELTLRSELNKGSTFTLSVPIQTSSAMAA